MKIKAIAIISCLGLCSASFSQTSRYCDVDKYVKNAETCEHLAGEWDSTLSKMEMRKIERDIVKYCGQAKKQLKTLKVKYEKDAEIQRILSEHDYDSVNSFQK
jgi:hypothetical protein